MIVKDNMRYVIEKPNVGLVMYGFEVIDSKETRPLCMCYSQKDAELIIKLLNKTWQLVEDERIAIEELGG